MKELGMMLKENAVNDTLKITHFAGQPVPENGLTVYPPQGGELTVYQHGGYSFTPDADSGVPGHEPVATYYSFLMEDIDGETTVGTFSLTTGDADAGSMHDFQAWSLPDLMDGQGGLDSFLTHADAHYDVSGGASGFMDHVVNHEMYASGDLIDDDVTRLLIASHHT